jgi:hypothetical protein
MPKMAEVKLSSCGLQKKLQLRNCGVAIVEQHFFKKLRNCECGSASFKLRLQTPKKVARAHLWYLYSGGKLGDKHVVRQLLADSYNYVFQIRPDGQETYSLENVM